MTIKLEEIKVVVMNPERYEKAQERLFEFAYEYHIKNLSNQSKSSSADYEGDE